MLQAAGMLPDLPEHIEGDYVLMGELGIHAELRRVPGALSLAYQAKPGQKLIVPYGNEKECALILAKPGHEGCGVFAAATLDEVIEFFQGSRKLPNAMSEPIRFDNAIPKAVDFGRIKGQDRAKQAATISAAGGHNLLLIGPPIEGKLKRPSNARGNEVEREEYEERLAEALHSASNPSRAGERRSGQGICSHSSSRDIRSTRALQT